MPAWYDGMSFPEIDAAIFHGKAPGANDVHGFVEVPRGFLDWTQQHSALCAPLAQLLRVPPGEEAASDPRLVRVAVVRAKIQEAHRRCSVALMDGPAAVGPLAEGVRYRLDEALLELGDLEADLLEEGRS